jgi:hypothetical protein
MTTAQPPTPPDSDSIDQDAKELAKLTRNFYAALNDLLPAAIRASKRGKHGLLRLISRKLPRPKLPQPEDPEDDRHQDEDAAAIAESLRDVFVRPPDPIPTQQPTKEEEKTEEPPKTKQKPTAPAAPPPPALLSHRTSGAPRSVNEEPWPGQSNFPRAFHRRLRKPG